MSTFGWGLLAYNHARTPEEREAIFKACEAWLWATPGEVVRIPAGLELIHFERPAWSLPEGTIENLPPCE